MRPDVKMGVLLAFVMVVVAGGYYMYRDRHENPIPLSGNTTDLQVKGEPQSLSPVASNTRKPSANPTTRQAQKRKPAQKNTKPSSTRSAKRNQQARNLTKNSGAAVAGNTLPNTVRIASSKSAGSPAGTPTGDTRSNAKTIRSNRQEPRSAKITKKSTRRDRPTQSRSSEASGATTGTQASGTSFNGIAVETHRVQPGDTFAMLAKNYYGDEKFTQYLLDHNRHIKSPTALRVGDSLKIPPLPTSRTFSTPQPSNSSRSPAARNTGTRGRSVRTYTVRPGDSFYAIAENELGDASRWEELFKLNASLVNGDPKKLQVGQAIALPAR